jgi:hypothetical protein
VDFKKLKPKIYEAAEKPIALVKELPNQSRQHSAGGNNVLMRIPSQSTINSGSRASNP